MTLGRVIGSAVSTIKNETLHGRTLLVIQPVRPGLAATGTPFLAADSVGAGTGETVLIANDGSCAAMALGGGKFLPFRSVVLGIVDRIDMGA